MSEWKRGRAMGETFTIQGTAITEFDNVVRAMNEQVDIPIANRDKLAAIILLLGAWYIQGTMNAPLKDAANLAVAIVTLDYPEQAAGPGDA